LKGRGTGYGTRDTGHGGWRRAKLCVLVREMEVNRRAALCASPPNSERRHSTLGSHNTRKRNCRRRARNSYNARNNRTVRPACRCTVTFLGCGMGMAIPHWPNVEPETQGAVSLRFDSSYSSLCNALLAPIVFATCSSRLLAGGSRHLGGWTSHARRRTGWFCNELVRAGIRARLKLLSQPSRFCYMVANRGSCIVDTSAGWRRLWFLRSAVLTSINAPEPHGRRLSLRVVVFAT